MQSPPRLTPSIVRPNLPRLLPLLFPSGHGIRSGEASFGLLFVPGLSSRRVFDSEGE